MRDNQIDGSETGEVPMSQIVQPLQARIQAHLAVAGMIFAGTAVPPASADIIAWSDANLVVPSTLDGLYINVETRLTGSAGSVVSGWDLNPYNFTGLTWFNATGTGMMRYPGLTTGSAGNLPLGTLVGPTASFGFGNVTVGFNLGEWQPNASNYFGFRFLASDGLTHYGWGRFVIGSSISGSDRFIAEIYFESVPGQPIAVGAGACTDPATYYVDADGDGFGAGPGLSSCIPIAGSVLNGDDCNDSNPSVNPNSGESCNGIDDDCNGEVDEGTLNSFFRDADGDGFGASGGTVVPSCLSALPGFVLDSSDCNDAEAAVNPAAQEICDGANIDEDCDLLADDDDSNVLEATKSNFYADVDGDGDGDGAPQRFCDLQVGYSATNTDHCPDFPGLFDPVRYFGDADGDGFGDPATWTDTCTTTAPVGFAANSGDACPSDPAKSAPGVCGCGVSDVDLNQNGVVDCVELTLSLVPSAGAVAAGGSFELGVVSGTPPVPMSGLQVILSFDPTLLSVTGIVETGAYETLLFSQYDNAAGTVRLAVATLSDPVTSGGSVASIGFAVKPGASSDCDARERISFATVGAATTRFSRADGQAFVPQLETITALSIDTAAPLVDSYAQTTELVARPDCSALAPNIAASVVATDDCSAAGALIVAQSPPAGSALTLGSHPVSLTITDEAGNSRVAMATVVVNGTSVDYYIDADGDGFGAAGSVPQSSCAPVPGWVDDSSDCNDELVLYGDQDGDGFGSNTVVPCTGVSNSDDCDDTELQHADNDADGFGAGALVACGVANNTDCNDTNAAINPGAQEVCDAANTDEDCDGLADNNDSSAADAGKTDFYVDADLDGSGSGAPSRFCDQPAGYSANADDNCPLNPELVNPVRYYLDGDADTYGDPSQTFDACSTTPPLGYISISGDCDDANAAINPGAQEVCDAANTDEDCDGVADDADSSAIGKQPWYLDADNDGYHSGGAVFQSCEPQVPQPLPGDCNDASPSINPGAPEVCRNAIDDDCDGAADEGCGVFTLYMTAGSPSIALGDNFTVRASCTAPPAPMSGVQMAVRFDASRLRLDAVAPMGASPMALEIAEQVDNAAGTLRYALGLSDPSVPLSGGADLCELSFTVLPGADTCGAANLAFFADIGPFTTRFTVAATAAVAVPQLAGLPSVNLDTTAPVLTGVPASDIEVYADAGDAGAFVPLPVVSASDACDGATAVTAAGVPADSFFPIGSTVVTWSTADAAGNTASAARTVTVLPQQLLDVTVTLEGAGIAPMSRTIRVGAGGIVEVRSVSLSQEIRSASGAYVVAVRGTAFGIAVPAGATLGCVSVKDPVHSVTAASAASVTGARWTAAATLLQGDSNGDDMVEIVDYGLWVTDRNAFVGGAAVGGDARSNFNGDLAVNNADFGYVAVNFFRVGETCTPGAQAPQPRERISVKELRRRGLGELVAADLNHDGWLDLRDIQMFMQGGQAAAPSALSEPAEPDW